jgi:hypothetical protein
MARPLSISVKEVEAPHITAPEVKKIRARMRSGLRPKAWEKLTKLGWKTVEARRKEVPAQNASTAVPLRSLVMAYFAVGIVLRGHK